MIVEGIYKDGRVELPERLEGYSEGARIRFMILDVDHATAGTSEPRTREELRQQAFAQMERGINLGGPAYPTREEIYDERLRRFDQPGK